MDRIKYWFRKIMLRRLLRKFPPDRYTISAPEAEQRQYDFFTIEGATREHGDVLIRSWNESENEIGFLWWESGASGTPSQEAYCVYEDILWDSLSVRHRFITWDIHYNSITEAFLHDLLRLPLIKWYIQKFRNLFITSIPADYRIVLLKKLWKYHQNRQDIYINDLLAEIHGPAIRLSNDQYHHRTDLQFLLESLQETGDVILRNTNNKNM